MGLLNFTAQKCVRALSTLSICDSCATVCPVNAIVVDGRLPSLNNNKCIECAACTAVCPTEALNIDDFNPIDFFFAFIQDEHNLVSCQKNVPCIASLGAEQLILLTGIKDGIVLDSGHCHNCDIGSKILPYMQNQVENVNYLLEASGQNGSVAIEDVNYFADSEMNHSDRRDFFRTFHIQKLGQYKRTFEDEIKKSTDEFISFSLDSSHTQDLRTKKITDRRKLFYTGLKRFAKPDVFHVVDATKITFTSQKLMDETKCTACEMCYRVCPTGALTSDMRNSKIDFDPFLCVKCHLCHDVCEPDAITLSPSYNLKEWYEPKVQNLVTFLVRRCDECDGLFSSIGGEKICRRCRLEEEEARELWGI